MKFLVGSATCDDFYGIYQTYTSLSLFHREWIAGVVVVDQKPDSRHGKETKRFVEDKLSKIFPTKYVEMPEPQGTAPPRNRVMSELAAMDGSDVTVCMDGHVDWAPGSWQALSYFFEANPETKDLVHGPLMYEDLKHGETHMADVWRSEMWGTWDSAWRHYRGGPGFSARPNKQAPDALVEYFDIVTGQVIERCPLTNEELPRGNFAGWQQRLLKTGKWLPAASEKGPSGPFEIPAMGMGAFACRKGAWLPFHPNCRGFGGEEWTTHVKYRKNKRKVWCVPGWKWVHRFARPDGVPYAANLTRENKIKNYALELSGIGEIQQIDRVFDHFTKEVPNPIPQERFSELIGECATCRATKEAMKARVSALTTGTDPNKATEVETVEQLFRQMHGDGRGLGSLAGHVTKIAAEHGRGGIIDRGPSFTLTGSALMPAGKIKMVSTREPSIYKLSQKFERGEWINGDAGNPEIKPEGSLTVISTGPNIEASLKAVNTDRVLIIKFAVSKYLETADKAVNAFIAADPTWNVAYEIKEPQGEAVLLSKDPSDQLPLPSLWNRMLNYGQAKAKDLLNGQKRVPLEVAEERLSHCWTCEKRAGDSCSACGCPLVNGADGGAGKVFYPLESCGLVKIGETPKWGPYVGEVASPTEKT